MSSVLNDTIGTAKKGMETAKEGTGHAMSRARSKLMDGLYMASDLYGALRGFNVDRGLGYMGLVRATPYRGISMFGAGILVGAGTALLLAPMSGAETRQTIKDWFNQLTRKTKDQLSHAEASLKSGVEKTKDTLRKAERKVEGKVAEGAEAVKEKAESVADATRPATTYETPYTSPVYSRPATTGTTTTPSSPYNHTRR